MIRTEIVGASDEADSPEHPEGSEEGGADRFLSSIASARQEGQSLFTLMHELGGSLSLDETLSTLALRLESLCPYDCIAIYIRRENKLIPEYVRGRNFHLFSSLEIPMGAGLSGWVAESRQPVVNGNPSLEPGYLNDAEKFSTLNSAISTPLVGSGGVVGVLTLYHANKNAFSRDHLRILLALTDKVALSIENALRYREAEVCAVTDALTGLPNARSLFLHLDSEIARCKRENAPLTVLVCDLDGFKLVNDNFGHLEGNKVLRAVAQGLRENCREYDFVARMGGDEFVILLPGHPAEAASAKACLLSEIARKAGSWLSGREGQLAMSVGEAIFPQDGSDAEQLLAEADRRMYKIKHERQHSAGTSGLEELRESVVRHGLAPVS
jgi:diguanylate cyclase (GGDEF)-like protein